MPNDYGKRSRHRSPVSDSEKNQRRRSNNQKDSSSSEDELVVFRILCPSSVIGSVIGKSGKVINSLRQETRARIKVVDPFPGSNKRVILIYCYVRDKGEIDINEDNVDEVLCDAQMALLRVHETIVNAVANGDDDDRGRGRGKGKEEAEVLVPSSQASNVIGKGGVIIKRLRTKTTANIRVNPKDAGDAGHSCAMSFDNFVQISGDSEAVKKALLAVSTIMFKFPPREEIPLDTSVPELPPRIIIPSNLPIFPPGSFYPSADAIVAPHSSIAPAVGATQHQPELHGYNETSSGWPMYPTALPVVSGYGGSSRSEELIVRVLCPSDKIGRVIGKGGSVIKGVRQTSGARIDVDDTKKKSEECLITVTSTESVDDEKSAAVEAVLLLQENINDDDDDIVNIRLLVPSKVIGCLIGKNGSIINDMRKRTKSNIRISRGEKPKCASSNDELVEVSGEVGNLRDALVQIILRLREDVLRDRDGTGNNNAPSSDSVYSSGLAIPSVPLPPSMPPVTPLGYDQLQRIETGSGLGFLPGSSMHGYGSLQAGDSGYGSFPSYSSKGYGGLPSYLEMVIPNHALSKVMGKGGANLANIQKISGADIEIVDSKSSRFERIAQISGTSEQKRAAENLIQAFIMST